VGRAHTDTAAVATAGQQPIVLAGLWRRLAALAYESVLLLAVLFVGAYLFVAIAGRSPDGVLRWIFFSYLACLAGAYFVFCWMRSGQTLAQKAWGMKVVGNDGAC
jgi:uncharacterized RDD family membrane protein YckC